MDKIKQVNRGYRWVILAINFFIVTLAYSGLTTWALALPDLMATFGISLSVASLGDSVFMAGYALGNFIMSKLAPRYGFRIAGLFGLCLAVIGLFGVPYAPNFGLCLFFRFLQGFGILWLVGVSSTEAWFPPARRGFASGMIGGGCVVGIGIGSLVATFLINMTGSWQGAFKVFAIVLFALTVLWAILFREPDKNMYQKEILEMEARSGMKPVVNNRAANINVLKTAALWLLVFYFILNCWQKIGYSTVLAGYCTGLGYTEVQAGVAVLLTGLIGIISTPFGGWLSDRLIAKGWDVLKARAWVQAIPGFFVAAIFMFLYPVFAPIGFGMAIFGAIAAGWGVPVTNATVGALPMDLLENEDAATKMLGWVVLFGLGIGGIIAPYIANFAMQEWGGTVCMIVLGIGPLIGGIISFLLPKHRILKADEDPVTLEEEEESEAA